MIRPDDLVEGKTYFRLNYVDLDLRIPALEPLVFLGASERTADQSYFEFQDASSYFSALEEDETTHHESPGFVMLFSQDQLQAIFDLPSVIAELQLCLSRESL